LESDESRETPKLVGFECAELVGQGGMGEVYRARHLSLGRDVAVKVLSGELAQSSEFRARFEREARLLAALDHDNIVRVFDYGLSADEEPYIAMELVGGGNLSALIPMPSLRALQIARELAGALEHAHARGVVHCDIKPENVLIGADGHVRLSDFGIARWLAPGHASLTRASRVLGTPLYMSPEALAGRAPDARMDVYSLGVLLSEMITGSPRLPPEQRSMEPLVYDFVRRLSDPNLEGRPKDMHEVGSELGRLETELVQGARGRASLPPDERSWREAVALLLAAASATVLYAGLVSFSPRVMEQSESLPFIAFGVQRFADGRVATLARFETLPTLGAAFSVAIALFAYGLLRRHWRKSNLVRPEPERSLSQANAVLWAGIALFALFVFREAIELAGFTRVAAYIPVLGGTLELVLLWLMWNAVLEALRVSRPLRREPKVWLGLALGLFPPFFHLMRLMTAG
jgi:serine/threonine protein kinase